MLAKNGLLRGEKDFTEVILEIGNYFKRVDKGKHLNLQGEDWWTTYVKVKHPFTEAGDAIIKHCIFQLHPSYKVKDKFIGVTS